MLNRRLSRIVILGASGFIGGALAGSLSREEGVEVIGHSSGSLDLTDPRAFGVLDGLDGPRTALVFASSLTPDKGQTIDTLMTNVTMAANVARYIEKHPVGLCVYVSSDAGYGFEWNPVTETTPVAPSGAYALAKYAGEQMMELAVRAHQVPLLILRLTGVYGPGDRHGAYGPNAFARSLSRDRTIRLFGQGEEERDHIYIDDVARLTVALLDAGATGLYNVATGESHSFAELVDAIRALVPYEITVTTAPRRGPITHRWYDTARLQTAVPRFSFTPLKDGLRETLSSFGAL